MLRMDCLHGCQRDCTIGSDSTLGRCLPLHWTAAWPEDCSLGCQSDCSWDCISSLQHPLPLVYGLSSFQGLHADLMASTGRRLSFSHLQCSTKGHQLPSKNLVVVLLGYRRTSWSMCSPWEMQSAMLWAILRGTCVVVTLLNLLLPHPCT